MARHVSRGSDSLKSWLDRAKEFGPDILRMTIRDIDQILAPYRTAARVSVQCGEALAQGGKASTSLDLYLVTHIHADYGAGDRSVYFLWSDHEPTQEEVIQAHGLNLDDCEEIVIELLSPAEFPVLVGKEILHGNEQIRDSRVEPAC